jgi:hypothetical protein
VLIRDWVKGSCLKEGIRRVLFSVRSSQLSVIFTSVLIRDWVKGSCLKEGIRGSCSLLEVVSFQLFSQVC